MTQSGQGDESRVPAARPPAHEGVVLPADGSGPWIPGTPEEQVAPAGGQPWGQPWGPQQSATAPPQQQYDAPQQQYGTQQYGAQQQAPQQQYGAPQAQPGGPLPPQQQPGALPQPQPQQGSQQQYGSPQLQQAQQYGAQPQQQYGAQPGPQQPGQQQYGAQQPHAPQPQAPQQQQQQQHHQQPAAPLPAPQQYGAPQAQPLPLPQEAPAGAKPGEADATQYIPYVPAAGPGALPPENPAESTQFLGRHQSGPAGAAPAPAGAPGGDADATQYLPPVPNAQGAPAAPSGAPFGIRPGAPEDRQPPAEFDNLFRADAGPPADATQQMPPVGAQSPHQQQPPYQQPQFAAGPQGRAARRNAAPGGPPVPGAPMTPTAAAGDAPRRRNSPLVLIAAVVVGCSVLGLGAGALLSGGEDDSPENKKPLAGASSPGAQTSPQAAQDPAEPQAKTLDALLADSNDSRASVISAVQSIGSCKNLPKAASDLRAAAKQRNELVTRLQGLTIDKLPDHTKLSASLTTAWKASAAADNHYAAWADQVAGKKGCRKGQARTTPQQQAGNRESGKASQAKKEAVGMWNGIAKRYGLTERDATQL
ncbi:hypothetical protein AR457_19895 [Streptomyces agglomeratus]|uniref:hypothetical protein n=1 Tax=Streptomyces agglomeratus TaxID=285458 RepID=UPI000854C0A3|nr:hypothetical protein [Streptomyces agglomeratus]OEJ39564.1 hypothetical protein BGK70_16755 [Streptomyces agglomeratus]OEJ46051.1 hypothetical protein AR457_19895 [Streptomyces agglomeratus]